MFLVSRPSKRFSTSSLSRKRDEILRQAGFLLGQPQETSSVRRLLVHVESQGDILILGEEEDQEVVPGLALLDGGIQADHKEHLPLILVGQQEEAEHCSIGDLVVEGLAMEV